MHRNAAAVALCALALAGCAAADRYTLSKDSAGRLVRLDTQTGEVALIEAGRVTPVQGSAAAAPAGPPVALPEGGKSWPTLAVPSLGDSSAALTSEWHDGKFRYVLELYPMSKRLKLIRSEYYSGSTFALILRDAAGKQMARGNLPASRLTRAISTARNAEELSAAGDIPMSKEQYDGLAAWQLLWNP